MTACKEEKKHVHTPGLWKTPLALKSTPLACGKSSLGFFSNTVRKNIDGCPKHTLLHYHASCAPPSCKPSLRSPSSEMDGTATCGAGAGTCKPVGDGLGDGVVHVGGHVGKGGGKGGPYDTTRQRVASYPESVVGQ